MGSIFILYFLLLIHQCLNQHYRRMIQQNADDYDLNNLDSEYDMPEFWEELSRSTKATKPVFTWTRNVGRSVSTWASNAGRPVISWTRNTVKPIVSWTREVGTPDIPWSSNVEAPWISNGDVPRIIWRENEERPLRQRVVKIKKTRPPTTTTRRKDVKKLHFPSLDQYEQQATPADETKYPWIAKIVHSNTQNYPHVCTAVCIEQNIFITSAKCLVTLKVKITSVVYQKTRIPAKAFVLPQKASNYMFDDIGFLVVKDGTYKGKWDTVALFDAKRTDEVFSWFNKLNYTHQPIQHKAIGYAMKKHFHKFQLPNSEFKLYEMDVVVDIGLCEQIFSKGQLITEGFFVPCYHTCTYQQYMNHSITCVKYLGAEGGAVYNFKTKRLLGVTTWGLISKTPNYEFPVGFSVPNSNDFYKDIACARKIKADKNQNPPKGHYQKMC